MIPRSYLYVPGDQPDKLATALQRGADALILDLEDAVAPSAKDAGREAVGAFLESVASGFEPPGAQLWLRINPGEAGRADIAAAWRPVLTGVMVAKTEGVAALERVDLALGSAERAADVAVGSTAVVPLLESAAAVLAARPIAAAPRVVRLQLGEADLSSELGLDAGGAGADVLQSIRTMVLLASAAARLDPPVAPVSTDFRDLEALRRSTIALAGMGFLGRACIHPAQIPVVNAVFTPDAQQIATARAVVDRFDAAVAAGRGVIVGDDGSMVDEAVVRQARRLLALSGGDDGTDPSGG